MDPRDKTVERYGPAKCPTCGSDRYRECDIFTTLLGGGDWVENGVRHHHDHNCRKSLAQCENGHDFAIRYQCFCPNCDWVGKIKCFCDTKGTVVLLKEDQIGTQPEPTK
jgi:hypothetical protein